MSEQNVQCQDSLALMPIMPARLMATSATEDAPPLSSQLHRFLDLVICDGRFIDLVTSEPRHVAEQLQFDLSAESEAELRAKPLEEHLADLYRARYPMALDPISIVIIVAAIIIIIAIAISRYSDRRKPPVSDRSGRTDLKL